MENNQALTMHPLFFDPIYKKAEIKKIDGKDSIRYQEDFWGTKVEEDGSVTFTMEAPKAETVEVSGFGGTLGTEKIALEKQANGLFSKNVKGILPGFHYHRWFVDGVQVTNPHAPFAYGCFGANNFFEMPREGQDFWYLKDVPHGDVQIHSYVSTQNDHIKKCYVYLPPSYRENIDQKYPVMYIQHGVGEDETSWLWNGKLNFIMDNLIAEGKCKDMIVVACAFAKKPDVIILDEPTSGLDGANLHRIAGALRQLSDEGKAVLVITHDLELVDMVCDSAIRLPLQKTNLSSTI